VNPQQYFTFSSEGLTFFKDGSGKFLIIEQWIREIVLYRRLSQIRFFKNFLSIYSFRTLWISVVLKKNSIASSVLDKRYLIASTHFQVIGKQIRELALEIVQIKLVIRNCRKSVRLLRRHILLIVL
jgi:hypothetical protein